MKIIVQIISGLSFVVTFIMYWIEKYTQILDDSISVLITLVALISGLILLKTSRLRKRKMEIDYENAELDHKIKEEQLKLLKNENENEKNK
jgi:hypothetical protein